MALLDMGDFAGGLLKYLRDHPVEKLTIAGGFGKLTKLAQGALEEMRGDPTAERARDLPIERTEGAERREQGLVVNRVGHVDWRRTYTSVLYDLTIAGVPTEAGTFSFKVRAKNPVGADRQQFTITVTAPAVQLSVTTIIRGNTLTVSGSGFIPGDRYHH